MLLFSLGGVEQKQGVESEPRKSHEKLQRKFAWSLSPPYDLWQYAMSS